jgi:adenosylhomocysteine nucleosidase
VTLGVVVAMNEEAQDLRRVIEDLPGTESFMCGVSELMVNDQVVVCKSGIGKINAASAVTAMLARVKINAVLSIGMAGSLLPHLGVGDIVVASGAVEHDLDLRPIARVPGEMLGSSSVCHQSDKDFVRLLKGIVERDMETWRSVVRDEFNRDATLSETVVASGDSLVTSKENKSKISRHFPYAGVVDMETAAVARVAMQYKVPWSALRIVSDTADSKEVGAKVLEFCRWQGSKMIADTVVQLVGLSAKSRSDGR